MKIKIPNYLTIGRIIIVPIFVLTFYLPGFYGDIIPFALCVIASFTDFLDGLLARMYKEESKLGELLDPIADKIINFQDYNAQTIGIIILWLSAFLTLYTGYDYLRKGIDHAISEDEKN